MTLDNPCRCASTPSYDTRNTDAPLNLAAVAAAGVSKYLEGDIADDGLGSVLPVLSRPAIRSLDPAEKKFSKILVSG